MVAENRVSKYPGGEKISLPREAKCGDILISRDKIDLRLNEVASDVLSFYEEKKPLVVVGVMNGALTVIADFRRHLYDKGLKGFLQDSVQVETYGSGTISSGVIRSRKSMDIDPSGKHILLVDDIVDTGQTLDWLSKKIGQKAESVESFALLSKPVRRKIDYTPKFIGFEIDDVWVEGYGMDSGGYGRENPNIIIGPSVDLMNQK
jgi:hypoxanthine phosphoribosyltransferase